MVRRGKILAVLLAVITVLAAGGCSDKVKYFAGFG